MLPGVIATLLVIPFFVTDSWLRRGKVARQYRPGPQDRGTTRMIGLAFVSGLVGAPLLGQLGWGRLPSVVAWLGLAMVIGGIAFRSWAMRTLGQFYTRTLIVVGAQKVVDAGPYRLIRHPGYSGSITAWTGVGLAWASWPATLLITALLAVAYTRRIRAEETMLMAHIGLPYREYMRHTKRLVPFLF